MDSELEQPAGISSKRVPEEDEQSSADEDEGPDWTKLPTVARPIIPKRGEKDFEPKTSGGSGLQRHVLDRARSAMLDALRATRTTSSKTISYGVWYPGIARAHVTVARGIHFTSMGHSVARISNSEQLVKSAKRLELLPEEALYLVERGAMFCWKESELGDSEPLELEGIEGVPMTVQQAFAEMIGREDLSLEKYQVYSYLKRLGYVVTRAKPPSEDYPQAAPFNMSITATGSFLGNCFAALISPFCRVFAALRPSRNWWRPVGFGRWLHHNLSYPSLFQSLRFLPSGHHAPLDVKRAAEPTPYQIFFNLYKPSTPFKKTAPPAPDFSIVVVNARTTPMPTLTELHDLFGVLPEMAPPGPRRKTVQPNQSSPPTKVLDAAPTSSVLRRLLQWVYPTESVVVPATRKPNPFAVLKAGKKMVVVAAVDAGTISFFRFGQGAFEDFPMS